MATVRSRGDLSALLAKLARTDKNEVKPSVNNAMLILAGDPELRGTLGYDEFRSQHLLLRAPPALEDGNALMPGPYPRPWGNEDVILIQGYLQRTYCDRFTRQTVEDAVTAEAMRNRFHRLREWLASLQHDGTPRLDTWLHKAFGTADDDYHMAVGSKFLIAAVRRVRDPGCKFDYLPILEGLQGIGKSRSIRALFGDEHFSDSLPARLEDKDAALALLGLWVLELAEIEQVVRAEVEVIKAFLSRSVDRYRPPYGKTYIERPRQGVLIGTTNSNDYLRDATGNRRFWPIKCQWSDVSWIAENREQLWAEAAAREASGEIIWLQDHDIAGAATAQQDARMEEDVWFRPVEAWLGQMPRKDISAGQVLTEALNIPMQSQDQKLKRRVTGILRQLKWEPGPLERDGKSRVRLWIRSQT